MVVALNKTPSILEQEYQLLLMLGRRLEAKSAIKRIGIGIDGVCQ